MAATGEARAVVAHGIEVAMDYDTPVARSRRIPFGRRLITSGLAGVAGPTPAATWGRGVLAGVAAGVGFAR